MAENRENTPIQRTRVTISKREKEIIINTYMKKCEEYPEVALIDIKTSVAEIVGISRRSVNRILKQFKENGAVSAPKNTRK